MKRKKHFDLLEYFLKEAGAQGDSPDLENQAQDPNMAPQGNVPPNAQEPPQTQTPAEQTKKLEQNSEPFSEFEESVIQKISFSRTNTGGGTIQIQLRKQGRPLVISWENNRTIVQKPNGDIVTLT